MSQVNVNKPQTIRELSQYNECHPENSTRFMRGKVIENCTSQIRATKADILYLNIILHTQLVLFMFKNQVPLLN